MRHPYWYCPSIMLRAASKATLRILNSPSIANESKVIHPIFVPSLHHLQSSLPCHQKQAAHYHTNGVQLLKRSDFIGWGVVCKSNFIKTERNIRSLSSATAAIRKARYKKKPFEESEESVISVPSNLKINPKSTCSPFFGLNRISPTDNNDEADKEVDEEVDTETKTEIDAKSEKMEENFDEEVENDDYEKETNKVLYSLENTPLTEPNYVIPLPKRLHVSIYSLFPESMEQRTPTELGTIHLSPTIFGQDPIRMDILHRVVVYQRNKRRGKRFAALTKTISTRSGSGKKMRPQKGGGQARAGHKRAAHWRGGAKAHGPKGNKQDYTTKLNKKVRKMGLRHALSQKLKEGNLIVLNELRGTSVKTKELAQALRMFEIGGKQVAVGATALILDHTEEDDEESVGGVNAVIRLASRNLFKVKMFNQLQANVYDILKHEKLMISLSALQELEKRLEP